MDKDLSSIYLKFLLKLSLCIKKKWEFLFEEYPLLNKEIPHLIYRKWELK